MENQTDQNLNPTPPVPPVIQTPVQTPPVSNPINPPAGGSKSKLPILIIGIILFLLVAGSAAGFYVFKQQSLKTTAKPTPTVIPGLTRNPVSPTPDPTSNWKTYIDTVVGFSFKYPNDWKITDESTSVLKSVEFLSTNGITLGVFVGYTKPSDWKVLNLSDYYKSLQKEGYQETQINNLNVMLYTKRLAEGIGVKEPYPYVSFGFFFRDGISYDFKLFTHSPTSKNPEPVLRQILSTFKFTN